MNATTTNRQNEQPNGIRSRGRLIILLTVGILLMAACSPATPAPTIAPAATEEEEIVEPTVAAVESTVMLSSADDLGEFLVDAEGMTLYLFTVDDPGTSNCYGGCAEAWPPFLLGEAGLTPVNGMSGTLDTTMRTDGTEQITYDGMPLYYFANDAEAGDTNGQFVGEKWFVVNPDSVVALSEAEGLGPFLTDTDGNSLYLFTVDDPGTSNCYGGCAEAWPPFLLGEAGLTPVNGMSGTLGATLRTDETRQITYDGMPLYYFANDAEAGDTNGQFVGEKWFVVNPDSVVALSEAEGLGPFLTDTDGNSLYLFTVDDPGTSNCYGGCAEAWPPFLLGEAGLTPVNGMSGTLGATLRTDETRQITYDGMPLYYFAGDSEPGDTNGQAVGDVWFVVEP